MAALKRNKKLWDAADDGKVNAVAKLLKEGADGNFRHPERGLSTPLFVASEQVNLVLTFSNARAMLVRMCI